MRERKKWVKEISIEKEWKEKVIGAKQIPKSDDEMKRRIPKGRIPKGRIKKRSNPKRSNARNEKNKSTKMLKVLKTGHKPLQTNDQEIQPSMSHRL